MTLPLHERNDTYLCFANAEGERVDFVLGRGGLDIECNSDWAGCTETGFGESVSQSINLDMARELHAWLGQALAAQEELAGEAGRP